jgi:predicted nuclease of restriction endonuclease-like RecB superfamily
MLPYIEGALASSHPVADAERLLYADAPGARLLVRAPRLDGRKLLALYNLELARAVLLDAERVRLTARGGWFTARPRAIEVLRAVERWEWR